MEEGRAVPMRQSGRTEAAKSNRLWGTPERRRHPLSTATLRKTGGGGFVCGLLAPNFAARSRMNVPKSPECRVYPANSSEREHPAKYNAIVAANAVNNRFMVTKLFKSCIRSARAGHQELPSCPAEPAMTVNLRPDCQPLPSEALKRVRDNRNHCSKHLHL
jgi:hypothetical protein